jgi:hypothetical protein
MRESLLLYEKFSDGFGVMPVEIVTPIFTHAKLTEILSEVVIK